MDHITIFIISIIFQQLKIINNCRNLGDSNLYFFYSGSNLRYVLTLQAKVVWRWVRCNVIEKKGKNSYYLI